MSWCILLASRVTFCCFTVPETCRSQSQALQNGRKRLWMWGNGITCRKDHGELAFSPKTSWNFSLSCGKVIPLTRRPMTYLAPLAQLVERATFVRRGSRSNLTKFSAFCSFYHYVSLKTLEVCSYLACHMFLKKTSIVHICFCQQRKAHVDLERYFLDILVPDKHMPEGSVSHGPVNVDFAWNTTLSHPRSASDGQNSNVPFHGGSYCGMTNAVWTEFFVRTLQRTTYWIDNGQKRRHCLEMHCKWSILGTSGFCWKNLLSDETMLHFSVFPVYSSL